MENSTNHENNIPKPVSRYPSTGRQVPVTRQAAAMALRAQGWNNTQIAKHLNMSVNTIKALAKTIAIDDATLHDSVKKLVPKAIQAIETALDKHDAQIAMRLLDQTLFNSAVGSKSIDTRINVAIGLLGPTQAPKTPGGGPSALSNQIEFLQNSNFKLSNINTLASLADDEAEVVETLGDA
jgi:hypothetical protein